MGKSLELLKNFKSEMLSRFEMCTTGDIKVIEYHGVGEFDVAVLFHVHNQPYLCYISESEGIIKMASDDFIIPNDLENFDPSTVNWV